MVIVTKNKYIVADKINHVVLHENINWVDIRGKNGKPLSVREVTYSLEIQYVVVGGQGNSRDTQTTTIALSSRKNALGVYKSLVEQIREQHPDQLYLDKALELLFTDIKDELSSSNIDEDYEDMSDKEWATPTGFSRASDTKKPRKPGRAKLKRKK